MKAALLTDRGVVKITGDDAWRFLHGLITADLHRVMPGAPRFGALLTPQGKIIADFILVEAEAPSGAGFFLDCPRPLVGTLARKLNLYKLRAKIVIDDQSDSMAVMALWDGVPAARGLAYPDPRLTELGTRMILPRQDAARTASELGAELVDEAEYEAHRIALGIPRGGVDFIYGDAFPHETDMDQLHGIDFDKGCYVGQEVVSRMEHRASARTRIVPVAYEGGAPEPGIAVMAGDKSIGTMGSASGGRGLALVRLDRAEDALAKNTPLLAGGVPLRLTRPSWARFAMPGEAGATARS
jgi:tRNA-modifying protein YgfZ